MHLMQVEGDDASVAHAIDIVTAAVDRYKDLCEGRCQGKKFSRAVCIWLLFCTLEPITASILEDDVVYGWAAKCPTFSYARLFSGLISSGGDVFSSRLCCTAALTGQCVTRQQRVMDVEVGTKL